MVAPTAARSHGWCTSSSASDRSYRPHFGLWSKAMRAAERKDVQHEQADLKLDGHSSSAVSPAARGRRGRSGPGNAHPTLSPHERRALPWAGPPAGAVLGERATCSLGRPMFTATDGM